MTTGNAPDWISAVATSLAALAALGAGITAFLQWQATKEQTRATLFSEKYAAYKQLKDTLQKAYPNEGSFGEAQAAQDAAHKLAFLFSGVLMTKVDVSVRLAWKVNSDDEELPNTGALDGQRKARTTL